MAHLAFVKPDNTIHGIIVVGNENAPTEEAGIAFLNDLNPYPGIEGRWIQTSFNTRLGIHYDQDGNPDSLPALRKNYAGLTGIIYSPDLDAFIFDNKFFPSWILNEDKGIYEAPVQYPTDGKHYRWNEEDLTWVEFQPPVPPTTEGSN